LNNIQDETLAMRRKNIPKARTIINLYKNEFYDWVLMRDLSPVIQALHEKLHRYRTDELEQQKFRLSDEEIKKADKLTTSVVNKIANQATEYIKYEGAGTIEFLVDKHKNFYFMEMNTRIQVEHPITEQVIDFDLICEQIKVAAGEKISGKNYLPKLHSIECRINAEDPFNDFRPSPGIITTMHFPGGHGVRLDTHVYSGYIIPPHYDSMIAKLITTAQTREGAIHKMKRALEEFIIEGVKTTIPFHLKLMSDHNYVSGNYTTKFMEEFNIDK